MASSSPRLLSGASVAEMPSVRLMITKSRAPRSSATARIIFSLAMYSSALTSALPAMCPQRLGMTWSSMWAAATPPLTYSSVVRMTLKTLP